MAKYNVRQEELLYPAKKSFTKLKILSEKLLPNNYPSKLFIRNRLTFRASPKRDHQGLKTI